MTLLIIFAVIAVASFIAYLQMKRERDELRFDIMFKNLECILNDWPVNKVNQLKILSYFQDLRACRFKNVEKVQVLWAKFCKDYKEVGREHLKEADEFEVQDGDLDGLRMERFE